jgi:hypothetical protein
VIIINGDWKRGRGCCWKELLAVIKKIKLYINKLTINTALYPRRLHPAPCTLHPAPCTLHPAPCTVHQEGSTNLKPTDILIKFKIVRILKYIIDSFYQEQNFGFCARQFIYSNLQSTQRRFTLAERPVCTLRYRFWVAAKP